MTNYYSIIEELRSVPGRLDKESILAKYKDDMVLAEIFRLGLDSLIRFNIRKIPEYDSYDRKINLTDAIARLDALVHREYTGHAGVEYLRNILSSLIADDAEMIKLIIAGDFDCGVQVATVNKIWPNLIKEFPVMLASAFNKKLIDKITWPAYVQVKADGLRNNIVYDGVSVAFFSRNGKSFDLLGHMEREIIEAAAYPIVIDGELVVLDEIGNVMPRKKGNGILTKAQRGTITKDEASRIRFFVWDAIPYDSWKAGKYDVPYESRLSHLKELFGSHESPKYKTINLLETVEVSSFEEAQSIFEDYLKQGEEGIILKSQNMIWEDKRSKGQIKLKAEETADMLCIGVNPGTGNREGYIGSLKLQSADGIITCNCGSGLTEEDFKRDPSYYIDKIIEITYNTKIQDAKGNWSLFLPIYQLLREDKNVANSFEELK